MPIQSKYPIGISVVICCYNSSSRLPDTLRCLANQKFTTEFIPWEIIVVDNASTDDTSVFAENEWKKYESNVELKVVYQPIPGLSSARELGISTAQFEYLLFCDDDNWLNEQYLDIAFQVLSANPQIGVLGGAGISVLEVSPPDWFKDLEAGYSVGAQGQGGEVTKERGFVYGAGSFYRKSIIETLHTYGFKNYLSDRKGGVLTSGGDVELCYAVFLFGFKIWYDERLKFCHFIPKQRLNWNYYKKMSFGFGYAFPFLMPYKLLINNQQERFDMGLLWLYMTGVYLILKSIFFDLPKSYINGNTYRVLADINSHMGFMQSLLRQKKEVKELYKVLKKADWVLDEYKINEIN